jgi:hypothetical protein
MRRSLAGALALLLGIMTAGVLGYAARAQAPWPASPSSGGAAPAPWPTSAPPGAGPSFGAGPPPAAAPPPGASICANFPKLSDEAQKRGNEVSAAIKAKVDRKQLCALMNAFIPAETTVVKFLVDNAANCGVPPQAIAGAKAGHEKSMKFRTAVCAEDLAHGKTPTLSDAIKSPTVDNGANTKTGRGTLDTLTGNPLAR